MLSGLICAWVLRNPEKKGDLEIERRRRGKRDPPEALTLTPVIVGTGITNMDTKEVLAEMGLERGDPNNHGSEIAMSRPQRRGTARAMAINTPIAAEDGERETEMSGLLIGQATEIVDGIVIETINIARRKNLNGWTNLRKRRAMATRRKTLKDGRRPWLEKMEGLELVRLLWKNRHLALYQT